METRCFWTILTENFLRLQLIIHFLSLWCATSILWLLKFPLELRRNAPTSLWLNRNLLLLFNLVFIYLSLKNELNKLFDVKCLPFSTNFKYLLLAFLLFILYIWYKHALYVTGMFITDKDTNRNVLKVDVLFLSIYFKSTDIGFSYSLYAYDQKYIFIHSHSYYRLKPL